MLVELFDAFCWKTLWPNFNLLLRWFLPPWSFTAQKNEEEKGNGSNKRCSSWGGLWLSSTNLSYLLWPGFLLLLSEAGTASGAAQVLQDWLQGHWVDFLGLQFPSRGSCLSSSIANFLYQLLPSSEPLTTLNCCGGTCEISPLLSVTSLCGACRLGKVGNFSLNGVWGCEVCQTSPLHPLLHLGFEKLQWHICQDFQAKSTVFSFCSRKFLVVFLLHTLS